MTTTLQKELEELEKLPEDDQAYIAEQLAKWRSIRAAISSARQQVAAGNVTPFDAKEIIREAREQYAGT